MRKLKNIDLDELAEQGIINEATVDEIWTYYTKKQAQSPNRLNIVFGVLGALLTGLGIILIIAHNWDHLSRFSKTILAFLPMIIGQIACAYSVFYKKDNAVWREGSGVFLFCSVGACMGMISQIYNLDGDVSAFLLTWMLLVLPLIYVVQSSMVSLLYIGGCTWYATYFGYSERNEPYLFWLLLGAVLPHYYRLYKWKSRSNFFNFHSWALSLSILLCLGLWSLNAPILMWLAYVILLAFYFLIGKQTFYEGKRFAGNPWLLIGILGTIFIFLIATFYDFWDELIQEKMKWEIIPFSQEFWLSIVLIIPTLYLFIKSKPLQNFIKTTPIPFGFLIFFLVFLLGYNTPLIGMILSNIFVLLVGLFFIYKGNLLNDLGRLNLGLLTMTALIICRFFDLEMTFVMRGILFVIVGAGFFIANHQLINKRKGEINSKI